ncbi:MAG: tetratricopeptide repeat protein [Polyangiales bacterium]
MISRAKTRSAAAVALSLLLAGGAAGAQSARETYARGLESFRSQRYAEALLAFESSYRAEPRPEVLYNIGLVQRALGRYLDAIDSWERFLAGDTSSVGAAVTQQARDGVTAMRSMVATVTLRAQPECEEVLVDGRPARVESSAIRVDPGQRVLECRAAGHAPSRQDLRLGLGERREVVLALRPLTAALTTDPRRVADPQGVPPTRAPARAGLPWWTWGGVGLTVLATGAAVGLGLAAQSSESTTSRAASTNARPRRGAPRSRESASPSSTAWRSA